MDNTKRPVSVWIAQIVLLLLAAVFLIPLVTLIASLPLARDITVIGLIFALFFTLGILAVLIGSFWGMARRSQWGRWSAVGALSFMVAVSVLGQITRPSGPMEYYEYANSTEAGAALVTQLVILGLFLWLILTLAFSRRVSSFFRIGESIPNGGELDT